MMSRSMYQFTPEILEFKNVEGKLMVLYDLGIRGWGGYEMLLLPFIVPHNSVQRDRAGACGLRFHALPHKA